MLARQAESLLNCVHVPVPTLDPEGLTTWIASRLPRSADASGVEVLLHAARQRGILLLVEDAENLPEESARALAELYLASDRAIRCVFTSSAEEAPSALVEAFDTGLVQVVLDEPMSRAETADYVAQRLAGAGVPASVAERFDARVIDQIHAATGGTPARINHAARECMAAAAKPLSAPAHAAAPVQAALWQDPFPETEAPAPRPVPRRRRPRRHAPRAQRRGRRRGWGLALLAGAATFGIGLILGPWLRGPLPGSLTEAPRRTPPVPAVGERSENRPPLRPTVDAPDAPAPSGALAPVAEVAAAPAPPVAEPGRVSFPAEPEPPPVTQRQLETERSEAYASAARAVAPSAPASPATAEAPSVPPEPEPAPEAPKIARPAPTPPQRATTAPPPEGKATAIIGPRAVAGAHPPFERVPSTPQETSRFLRGETTTSGPEAALVLRSDTPAAIEIDGRSVGSTPLRVAGLRPGTHRLIVRFVDGVTMSRTLELEAGDRDITLYGPVRRPPPAAAPASP